MNRHQLCDDHDEVDSYVPLLSDHEQSLPVLHDDTVSYSPAVSTVSAQSQELKYIFDQCPGQPDQEFEVDAYSDYSHVNIRPKPCHSDGSGYVVRPPPPPYSHRYEAIANARTGAPYSVQHPGVAPNNGLHLFRSQPPVTSASQEDTASNDPSRRRSWSPRQNAAGYHPVVHRGSRGCYSSNTVDWDGQGQQLNPPAYDSAGIFPPLPALPPPPPPPSHSHSQGLPQGYQHNHGQLQRPLQGPVNSLCDAESLPPRLAPVSGVLSEKLSRNLIRPIAFKPTLTNACQSCREDVGACCCQGLAPQQSQSLVQLAAHHDGPLYICSPGLRSFSASQMAVYAANINDSSSSNVGPVTYNREYSSYIDNSAGVNVDQSPIRRLPSTAGSVDVLAGTPSPSDSGVGELEAMLKEREAEILTLRQVMDRNERAIFQVYEEKKTRWQQDLREIKNEYENRLKVQQEKASWLEQALSHGTSHHKPPSSSNVVKYSNLQVEKEAVMAAAASARNSQQQPEAFQMDTEHYQASATPGNKKLSQSSRSSRSSRSSSIHSAELEAEVTEEMAMKNTEIMALRAQLRGLQGQLQDKDRALAALREESAGKSEELQLAREQIDRLLASAHPDTSRSVCHEYTQTSFADFKGRHHRHVGGGAPHDDEDDEKEATTPLLQPAAMSDEEYVLSLERQIDDLRLRLQEAEALVESERLQWLEEKNKVIRYQKQLQLNYVQMQRKNTALEAEVEQLTLELERRDLKLTALSGEEESVC